MSAGSGPLLCSILYRYCPCHIFLKIASSFLPTMAALEWDDSFRKYGLAGMKDLRFHSTSFQNVDLSRGQFHIIDKLFSEVADNSLRFASEESSRAKKRVFFLNAEVHLLMLKRLRSITSLNMKLNSPQALHFLWIILNNFIIKSRFKFSPEKISFIFVKKFIVGKTHLKYLSLYYKIISIDNITLYFTKDD